MREGSFLYNCIEKVNPNMLRFAKKEIKL